ncbi:MAG: nucleotidyl transferase AbiEii/AbiGii toxin family protein [Pirellulales bacterium]
MNEAQRVPQDPVGKLQEAVRKDLDDFMTFEVASDAAQPEIQNERVQYDGLRFRVEGTLAGTAYAQPFGVDVAFGDPILGEPEVVVAEDVLAFAGMSPPTPRIHPIETHVAEQLHAYTMPRQRPHSRVKDLPDIALLARVRSLDARRLRAALAQTLTFRQTHAMPAKSPEPLLEWTALYPAMAREDQSPRTHLDEATQAARTFLWHALLRIGAQSPREPASLKRPADMRRAEMPPATAATHATNRPPTTSPISLGRARPGPLSTAASFKRRIAELAMIDIHGL